MKKRLLIIIISVVILIGLAAALFFLFFKPEGEENNSNASLINYSELSLSDALLRLYSKDELTAIEKNYNIKATISEDKYYFDNVSCFDETFSFSYSFNEFGYLMESNVYGNLIINKEETKEKCKGLVNSFSKFFGVDEDITNYAIYSDNGVLDVAEASSYELIYDGSAILEFRVRDTHDSFWVLKIQRINSDNLLCTIEHFVGNEEYAEKIANIDLT